MKQKSVPQQTHFIGVLLPEDITLTLEDCRRYMNEVYGCKSGQGTPIHVILVPPFRLQEEYSTADLINAIEKEVLPQGLGFTAHIDNFDAFGDRTLFANVVAGENWTKLRDKTIQAILNACPGCTKKDKKPFQPHATVANRDIPVIPSSWDYRLPDDEKVAKQARLIVSLLKKHKSDTIIIATDAVREGELIARECLLMAG